MQRRKFLATASVASSLMAAESLAVAPPQKSFVVKNGKSRFDEKTKIGGISPNDIKISSKDTNGLLTVFEYSGREKGGPPLHIHPNQDEVFFILEGTYKFQVGDETHQLGIGDIIFLPRNVPHTFAQLTDNGKILFFFQPSGQMEDYFRAIGKLKAPPSPQEGAKIFADHDMKVVGPPLSF
ncbi:MAG: cupin domain-containing protein [Runella sp.]